MSDIVKRLNDFSIRYAHEDERQATIRRNETVKDAVDRIAALEAKNAELRKALKPFAAIGREMSNSIKTDGHAAWGYSDATVTFGDFRDALDALEAKT